MRRSEMLNPKQIIKSIAILFALLVLITSLMKCSAQERFSPFGVVGGALVSTQPGAELHAGVVFRHMTASYGFVAGAGQEQPMIFQFRAGYFIGKHVHVYAGPAHLKYKFYDKRQNSNSYHVGAQVHGIFFDNGGFYASVGYTPGNPMVGVGMSFHLIKSSK
jgi:hypothetical protein